MAVAVIIVPDDFSAKAYMRVRRSLADSGMKTIVACAGEKRDLTSSNGKKTIQPKWNVAQT